MNPVTKQMSAQRKDPSVKAADTIFTQSETLAGLPVEVARRRVAREFREQNIDAPELDARIIVGHALKLGHTALVAQSGRVLAPEEADAVAALAARRLAHEPIGRILGCKEFWGLPFKLNADTLLPRPETETVVEATMAALDGEHRSSRVLRIVDLGTGSGALLLALLSELPNAFGIGTDISVTALGCARDNAAALGLSTRTSFVACDYGAALEGPVDVVVSNPPYVARGEIAGLQPEVRDYDPRRALDGGPDGLDGYREVAAHAPRLLAPNGVLAMELGRDQLSEVTAIFAPTGLAPGAPWHDLAGTARALVLRALP
jgi:release factor glutamine methyltransferase